MLDKGVAQTPANQNGLTVNPLWLDLGGRPGVGGPRNVGHSGAQGSSTETFQNFGEWHRYVSVSFTSTLIWVRHVHTLGRFKDSKNSKLTIGCSVGNVGGRSEQPVRDGG